MRDFESIAQLTTGAVTVSQYPYKEQLSSAEFSKQCAVLQQLSGGRMPSGNKPVVICAGHVEECKDLDAAQLKAEELAHQKSADAYILKPIKRVAPKRDVVTTDL